MKTSEVKTTANYFEALETATQTTYTEDLINLTDALNDIATPEWNKEAAELFQEMSDKAAETAKEQIEFLYPEMENAA